MRKIYHFKVNLIIEQGNTYAKVAVYDEKQSMKAYLMFKEFNKGSLQSLFETYPLKNGIYCTVTDVDEELVAELRNHLSCFIFLDEKVRVPVTVKYKTPHTLGKDRLAAVVGAHSLQPDRNLLIIDAGTCITYEWVEAGGVYRGGNISPGMTTRFKALNHYTRKLPLIEETDEVPVFGTCTEEAIRAGVVNGIAFEMDGYIDRWKQKYGDVFVFLTGGHAFYFESRLKNPIFADSNLVLIGLNRILEYNVEN